MIKGYVPQGVIQNGVDANGKPVYVQNTKPVDPNVYWSSFYGDDKGVATPFIYDASYIKMREITLAYRLPVISQERSGHKTSAYGIVSRNPLSFIKMYLMLTRIQITIMATGKALNMVHYPVAEAGALI